MKKKNSPSKLMQILQTSVIAFVFIYFYKPEVYASPLTFSEICYVAFMLIMVNIPLLINMYVGESKADKSDDNIYNGRSAKELTLQEKLEVAKDLKESYTFKVSWKQWVFIIGSTVFCGWYFLHGKENPSAENVFTSVFLGLFFSVVLVGLAKIIQDEKDKNSKSK